MFIKLNGIYIVNNVTLVLLSPAEASVWCADNKG
jgi:hypothetical protein